MNPSPSQTDEQASAHRASPKVNGYPSRRPGLPQGPRQARRHINRLQRAASALIAAACVFAAAWYVPRIVASDDRSLSGAVTSNGIIYLNFTSSGQVGAISARVGQKVSKGQLLATEAAPQMAAVLSADRAAIAADQAELAAALATGGSAAIATARAGLARDQAQLDIDQADGAGTRIVAPAAGTVVAVNGQPGETADAEGIRDYSAQSQGTPITQQPLFSLLPEGPQSSEANGSAAAGSLPVVALRTSSAWQVSVLVPEDSVTAVRPGQVVRIDVPAAGITDIPGRVQEVLAVPVATSQGTDYQAVVTVLDHQQNAPPSGMAANVQLGS